MNFAFYQKILKENVQPSVHALKLKRTQVMEQDNSPNYTSESTSEGPVKIQLRCFGVTLKILQCC